MTIMLLLAFTAFLAPVEAKYLKCPESTTKCGCSIRVSIDIDGHASADCSNQPSLDFECLAALKPKSLNLSGNSLKEVPYLLNDTGFQHLKHLDLSNNNIEMLSQWNFGSMLGLESINLSGNQLTDLPRYAVKVDLIDISNNNLTDIDSIIGLVNTQAIVKGNPIRCRPSTPMVKRIYDTGRNVTLDCIYGDSEIPRPLPIQLRDEVNENETASMWNIWHFLYFIVAMLFGFCIYIYRLDYCN
ncbi:leucine-rich repeat neuronal protein 3-like isoform X2 [Drosophila obscura]|nr:leucine-rich repeat neuronal protein 3-like isoform X2 [Drosophila obscura]